MKIHLGSAQFGLPYGITNNNGRVSTDEVKNIISLCEELGIVNIDTAHDYGAAEEILGEVAKSEIYKLTTKLTLGSAQDIDGEIISQWDLKLKESLKRLQRRKVHTLLVHDSSIFRGRKADEAETWLHSVKERGLADCTGTSIYCPSELDGIPEVAKDCIQVPVSIYNQSTIRDNRISELALRGKTVIARSIFLQGLLLTSAANWPSWMPDEFKMRQKRLEEFCSERGMTLLDACLGFARGLSSIQGVAIGVCSRAELSEIGEKLAKVESVILDYEGWDASESPYADPRNWPKHTSEEA